VAAVFVGFFLRKKCANLCLRSNCPMRSYSPGALATIVEVGACASALATEICGVNSVILFLHFNLY